MVAAIPLGPEISGHGQWRLPPRINFASALDKLAGSLLELDVERVLFGKLLLCGRFAYVLTYVDELRFAVRMILSLVYPLASDQSRFHRTWV